MDRWKRFARDKMTKYENKSKLNNWQECDSSTKNLYLLLFIS